MRLALLGLDSTTAAIARAAQSGRRDQIVLACDVDLDTAQALLPAASFPFEPWETLLAEATGALSCDAVLVGRDHDEERRLDQLRRLVQAGVPIMVSHPLHLSMLAYYELDMIRREMGAVIVPILPARLHPLAAQVRQQVEALEGSELSEVDQVIFERALEVRTRETVEAHFASDIDLLRFVAGEVNQLGAMGSPGVGVSGELLAYSNLAVQMSGPHRRMLRWSIHPAHEFSGARLSVSAPGGRAVLTMPEPPASWRLDLKLAAEAASCESQAWNPHSAALEELRAATSGEQSSRWPDAARAIELTETIDRSLAKGRVIDLVEQEFSDVSTFKGLMTGIGCGLLLASLVGVVAAIVVGNFLKHAGFLKAARVVGAVPYVLVAVFVLFLVLQLLLKLTQPRSSDTPEEKRP